MMKTFKKRLLKLNLLPDGSLSYIQICDYKKFYKFEVDPTNIKRKVK